MNRESTNAGYPPAARLITIVKPAKNAIVIPSYENVRSIPARSTNVGNNSSARTMPRIKARVLSRNASPRNWRRSCCCQAPSTLRMPTSFARFVDRPTARTTKLMHAIRRMRTATDARMYE